MLSAALNPGLLFLAAAALTPFAPQAARKALGLVLILAAVVLPFANPFGPMGGVQRLGVELTPVLLDPLAQLAGLTGGLSALAIWLAWGGAKGARLRDSAFLTVAGGALGAVYAGDLISFVALLECASLALAALVFTSGGQAGRAAASTVLAWQSGAGACVALGAGAVWAAGGGALLGPVASRDPATLLLLLGLLLKLGAPPAHLALRAAAAQAGPMVLAGLLCLGLLAPVYALTRCFAGEELLRFAAIGMGVYAALQAPLARGRGDLAVLGALGALAPVLLAVGLGGERAAAAAGALLFAAVLSLTLLCLRGPARGAAGLLPALLCAAGAGAVLALPGFAGFAPLALLLQELAARGAWTEWVCAFLAPTACVLHLARLAAPHDAQAKSSGPAPFTLLLAQALLAAVLMTAGLSPGFLLALAPPHGVAFAGFDLGGVLARSEAVLAAAGVFGLLRAARLFPTALRTRSGDPLAWLVRLRLPAGLSATWRSGAIAAAAESGRSSRRSLRVTSATILAREQLLEAAPILFALLAALGVWLV